MDTLAQMLISIAVQEVNKFINLVCHPACRTCQNANNIYYPSNNDYKQCTSCSMISGRWDIGPDASNTCLPSNIFIFNI